MTTNELESHPESHWEKIRARVNEAKSGTGRVWERKFLGFQLNRKLQIGIAPESIERVKAKVRELWRGNQSRTSEELREPKTA